MNRRADTALPAAPLQADIGINRADDRIVPDIFTQHAADTAGLPGSYLPGNPAGKMRIVWHVYCTASLTSRRQCQQYGYLIPALVAVWVRSHHDRQTWEVDEVLIAGLS